MKKCPHCGKQIEMNSIGCPHCQRLIKAPKDWYSMKMQGASSAEIFIYTDIGQPSFFNPDAIGAKEFKDDLQALGPVSELIIRINSYGGEIFDGNAIYNLLLEHKAAKTVIIDGIAASQASVIAMVADPGKMKMRENAFMMIHNASMCVCGTKEDLERYGKLLGDLEVAAIKAYQRHAKDLTDAEIQELIDAETWMNAEDAKTYGFADEIIEGDDVDEPATNTGLIPPVNIRSVIFNRAKTINPFQKTSGPQRPINKGDGMKKCPHCGKDVAEGLQFCGHCGKAMNAVPVDPLKAAHDKEVAEARAESAKNEQKRTAEIVARCAKHSLPVDFQTALISGGESLEVCITKILDKIEETGAGATPVTPDTRVQNDEGERFRMHACQSLQVALGVEKSNEAVTDSVKNPGPRDLHQLVRACLAKEGKLTRDQIDRLSAQDIATHAIRMSGMGSSDLPYILADTMNKEFKGGFEDEPTTFQEVVAEVDNPNFMSKSMTKLSGFSDVDELVEGQPFKQGKFSDKKESIQLTTHGKLLTLTRNLMVNNDTQAISLMPRAMSGAMKRKMNRDFYDLLTYNTLVGPLTTEDGVAFFNDASHGNLKATSGVPSVSSLGVADQKMMEQTLPKATVDAATTYLNLTGRILLTGTANRMTVLQLLGSANDPAATDGKLVFNPYQNVIRPIFDAYLQAKLTAASKTYAWYMFAGPSVFRNWIVAYLSGYRTPTLRSEPSRVGEALGVAYDIYFDYKFGFEDYRGCIQNDGA